MVKRCEMGLARSSSEERMYDPNRDRTFLVEKAEPRGKYGKLMVNVLSMVNQMTHIGKTAILI